MLKGFWKNHKGMKFRYKLKELKWELKYAWQRAWRGYDDVDIFALGDCMIDRVILLLEDFIETHHGHPVYLTPEEWENILIEMLQYFRNASERYVDDNCEFDDLRKQYEFMQKNLEEGMKLFTKWCYNLWD